MDFFSIGSMGSFAKNFRLQAKWELKKAGGDLTKHMTGSLSDTLKPRKSQEASVIQQMVDRQREEPDGGEKLQTILDKAFSGKKLTEEEKQYLQAKDPLTYRRLQETDSEQKRYEQELRRCRTRDEVRQVKQRHLTASLATVNSTIRNPAIPEEKKLLIVKTENLRARKLEDSTRRFVRSEQYAKLPSEQEKEKAERDERKTRAERLGVEQPGERRETEEPRDAERDETPEQPETDGGKAAAARERQARPARPETQEQRKVRRANARAAYAAAAQGGEPEPEPKVSVEA